MSDTYLNYIEDRDYVFVEVNGAPGLKILSGDYIDVAYQYHNVTMQDAPDTSDTAVLSFEFVVVDVADHHNGKFFDNEFKTVIGDILMSILCDRAKREEDDLEFEQIDIEESEL
jgi:hypothetical protein